MPSPNSGRHMLCSTWSRGVGDQPQSPAFRPCSLTCWFHTAAVISHTNVLVPGNTMDPLYSPYTSEVLHGSCLARIGMLAGMGSFLAHTSLQKAPFLGSWPRAPSSRSATVDGVLLKLHHSDHLFFLLFHFYFKSDYLGPPGKSKMISLF